MHSRPFEQAVIEGLQLEGISQRELNQARSSDGRENLAERTVREPNGFDVVDRWISEICVVPDVEEIRREMKALVLGDRESLNQRKIPVLLKRSAVNVAAEIAEDCYGSVATIRRAERRCRNEIERVEISIESAVNVAAGGSGAD